MSTKNRRVVNGYVLLYRPDHFNCFSSSDWKGYVYEHRYVMEQHLGRALSSTELVHHLDCDKTNNQLSNLIVLSRADHVKLHGWIDNGAPICESYRENGVNSGKANPSGRVCQVCEGSLSSTQKQTCSRTCHNQHLARVSRKVERPSFEQLTEDYKNLSIVKIGKKYGVSDNAVRKWMAGYLKGMSTLSQADDTSSEGAETSGGVQSP